MKWAKSAWYNNITAETVWHCFVKALPRAFTADMENEHFDHSLPSNVEIERQENLEDELHGHLHGIYGVELNDVEYQTMINAEYEHNAAPPMMSDDDIIALVRNHNAQSDFVSEQSSQEEDPAPMPLKEKVAILSSAITILDDEHYAVKKELRDIRDDLRRATFAKQSSLDTFFLMNQ